VIHREKWKDIVRQAKAHSGLYCQWKKKQRKYTRVRQACFTLNHAKFIKEHGLTWPELLL